LNLTPDREVGGETSLYQKPRSGEENKVVSGKFGPRRYV